MGQREEGGTYQIVRTKQDRRTLGGRVIIRHVEFFSGEAQLRGPREDHHLGFYPSHFEFHKQRSFFREKSS
jgi:hypothetical protein